MSTQYLTPNLPTGISRAAGIACERSRVFSSASYIVRHDGAYFSYGSDHILIGEYRLQAEASRAIPLAHHAKPQTRPPASARSSQPVNRGRGRYVYTDDV